MKYSAFFTCLVSIVAFGCSPSHSTPSPASTPDQACVEFASNYCNRLASCSQLRLKTSFESESACETRMKPVCLSLLQAPGTGFTPETYDACAKAYAAADCDMLQVFGYRPTACQIQGTLANGSACGDGSQCKSGYCTMDFFTVCGVCADPVPAGGQCSKSAQCEGDLGCVSPGTCTALAKQGASCASVSCAGGLVCINGTCNPPLIAGATCDPNNDYCDVQIGLHCDTATQKCVEFPTAAIGSSCGNNEICLASGNCNETGSTAMCEAAANDGTGCDASSQQPCKYPALCVNNVCTLPNSACH